MRQALAAAGAALIIATPAMAYDRYREGPVIHRHIYHRAPRVIYHHHYLPGGETHYYHSQTYYNPEPYYSYGPSYGYAPYGAGIHFHVGGEDEDE
jgi:hypothetical protein